MQSCCFAYQIHCFFDVLIAETIAVSKSPFYVLSLIFVVNFQRYDRQEKEKKTKPTIVQLYEV